MDVLIVGSIVVDLISYTNEFPGIGETVLGCNFKQGFGGKGANQAVMANKLGAKTGFIGKVGNDLFGKMYLEHLNNEGIDISHVKMSENASTGTAAIIVRQMDGANNIIVVPGANYELTENDVTVAQEMVKNSKVLLCQLEIPIRTTLFALSLADQYGVKTILNPAPAPDSNDWPDISQLPGCIHVFCPNESEASAILKCRLNSVEDAISVIKTKFLEIEAIRNKIRYPMITMGKEGVVFGDSADKSIHHVQIPELPGSVIDTTGAGDCFAGSLAYFLAKQPNLSMKEAVTNAVKLASISVRKPGTQTSFPELNQL